MSSTISRRSSITSLSTLGSDVSKQDFDIFTVMSREGYPTLKPKSQPWRAQMITLESEKGSCKVDQSDDVRGLVRGGKIYIASTG